MYHVHPLFPNPPPPPLFPNLSSTTQAIFESPVTEGCGAATKLPPDIKYLPYNDPYLNVNFKYPQDFINIPKPDHIRFQYTIPVNNAPNCPPALQTEHALDFAIFQIPITDENDDRILVIAEDEAVKLMFTDTTSAICGEDNRGSWTTPQGFAAKSDRCVINPINPDENKNREAQILYAKIDDHLYVIIYSVVQEGRDITFDEAPDNFNIYGNQRIQTMLDSLCFPKNTAEKPCPSGPDLPPTEQQTITKEEWVNPNYRGDIPGIADFDKVIITCAGPSNPNVKCLDQPKKIIEINPFAGFNCISNHSGCDLGKLDVTCVSDVSKCNFKNEVFLEGKNMGGFKIHRPFALEGGDLKSWTAASIHPHVWILDRIFDASSIFFTPPFFTPKPDLNIKFTTNGLTTGGQLVEGKFSMSLQKTEECINGICREK